jgi:hypothetical protein
MAMTLKSILELLRASGGYIILKKKVRNITFLKKFEKTLENLQKGVYKSKKRVII